MPCLNSVLKSARARANMIRGSGCTIYESVLVEKPQLYFSDTELEVLLTHRLLGQQLSGPIRTRSKRAKQIVAEALGYAAPSSFKKTSPRFPGQDLDVYVQVRNNMQIWNQDISVERRYVLIRPYSSGIIGAVRIIRGQELAEWDRTSTLTSKYQARRISGRSGSRLVSQSDTAPFIDAFDPRSLPAELLVKQNSSAKPAPNNILSIAEIYGRSLQLIGSRLRAVREDQDRVRGELLQEAVSSALGIGHYENHGQWPDIVAQVLEVKLQTSPTIDLGLVSPNDRAPAVTLGYGLRHCDARYLIVYGDIISSGETELTEIVVSNGVDFYSEYVKFGGLVKNSKLQIPLPRNLFES